MMILVTYILVAAYNNTPIEEPKSRIRKSEYVAICVLASIGINGAFLIIDGAHNIK